MIYIVFVSDIIIFILVSIYLWYKHKNEKSLFIRWNMSKFIFGLYAPISVLIFNFLLVLFFKFRPNHWIVVFYPITITLLILILEILSKIVNMILYKKYYNRISKIIIEYLKLLGISVNNDNIGLTIRWVKRLKFNSNITIKLNANNSIERYLNEKIEEQIERTLPNVSARVFIDNCK